MHRETDTHTKNSNIIFIKMSFADINQQIILKASQNVKKTASCFKCNPIKMDHIGVYYGSQTQN